MYLIGSEGKLSFPLLSHFLNRFRFGYRTWLSLRVYVKVLPQCRKAMGAVATPSEMATWWSEKLLLYLKRTSPSVAWCCPRPFIKGALPKMVTAATVHTASHGSVGRWFLSPATVTVSTSGW